MRILMIARSTLYTSPGGDTTQTEMTAKYLRLMGVEVHVALAGEKINYSAYDLIHFFNIIRPDDILPHIKTSVPFVVSTIFADFSEYDKKARKGIPGLLFKYLSREQIEYLKVIARFLIKGDKIKSTSFFLKGQTNSIKRIASQSKLLLPNSHSEYRRLCQLIKFNPSYLKIVNAIDHNIFSSSVEENEQFKDFVICVGKIEGLKNQLNLIKAIIGTNIPLAIIGKPTLNQVSYYEECKRLASRASNIHFVEFVNHENLASIYKAAKVHALPSWAETTGLSSLEAAAMGCNLVITKKGDTEEYFEDMAFYCEPDDVESIRKAIINAYHAPRNCKNLQSVVLERYTWKRTALQTYDAYKQVLENLPDKRSTAIKSTAESYLNF